MANSRGLDRIREGMERALSEGIGSGMAASFGRIEDLVSGRPATEIYAGRTSGYSGSDEVGSSTRFDLASLSKILGTTLLAMKRVEEGSLRLDEAPVPGRPFTWRQLLRHASGLPAWRPFYEAMIGRFGTGLHSAPVEERSRFFFEVLDQVGQEAEPGERIVYSDLGFLHLGRALSGDFGGDVAALWGSARGVGLHYRSVSHSAMEERLAIQARGESVALTEICPWRGPLAGLVHDDNCFTLGGVGGHAGVFGTLPDLLAWIGALFREEFVSMRTLREFSTPWSDGQGGRRALGFDCPAQDGSGSTGFAFSPESIGHLGFTGTSLWMDPVNGHYAVLLTNRVHPTREDNRIRVFRRAFHEELRNHL
jgi:CubicO group peptidase (beta-lactamase class C family)